MIPTLSPFISISARNPLRRLVAGVLAGVTCLLICGCHDGPLYGLKHVNPYFTMREWKRDRELGVTDQERSKSLQSLAAQIGRMNSSEQAKWSVHLEKIIETDPSPEMRRLSVMAASRIKSSDAIRLIERGLDDDSLKVQMEACRSLGNRTEPEAIQLLASTLGTTPELDVKNSAIAGLGKHKGNIPLESLRLVLDEQDPATVHLAMQSLKGVMGKDYGTDPKTWIAAIDKQQLNREPTVPNPPIDSMSAPDEIRFAEGDGATRR